MSETSSERMSEWSKEREKTLAEANKEAKTINKQSQKAVQDGHRPTRKDMESHVANLKQKRREAYVTSRDSLKTHQERILANKSELELSRKIHETLQRIENAKPVSGVDVLHQQAMNENMSRTVDDLSQKKQKDREAVQAGNAKVKPDAESKPKFLDTFTGWFKKAS